MSAERTSLEEPWGFVVCRQTDRNGRVWYAEMEPAPRKRALTSLHARWWWEVNSYADGDAHVTTHAYTDGGSGGAFTLRRAVEQASDAIEAAIAAADLPVQPEALPEETPQ